MDAGSLFFAEILEVFFYEPKKCAVAVEHGSGLVLEKTNIFRFNLSGGQFHERFTSHVSIIKFSIVNNSVIVGSSSILSLICDHDIFHVRDKELVAAISAGSGSYKDANATLSFSPFYELCKCAVIFLTGKNKCNPVSQIL